MRLGVNFGGMSDKNKEKKKMVEIKFGEFGGLVEFLFRFKLAIWPSAKSSSAIKEGIG